MRIAITTPNGNVGRHLTRMLVRAGVRPVLLARHPPQIARELRPLVDVIETDSLDPDEVVAATRGVDAVYWVNPSPTTADPLGENARASEAIVNAIRANGIRRVVFQSSVGAEKRHGVGEIDGLAATEVSLDALDVDVTHLRCGYFFSNLTRDVAAICQGEVVTVLPVDHKFSWVAPRDVAEMAALCLLDERWQGRHVRAVHGPRDLSWCDVTGHPFGPHRERGGGTPDHRRGHDVELPGVRACHGLAQALLGMSAGIRDDFRPEQPRTVASTTPTRLTGCAPTPTPPAATSTSP